MHLDPVITSLRAAVNAQALVGDDPDLELVAERIADALEPAIRQAALDLAQQAASEIGAQLAEQRVDVVLSGRDLELRVVDDAPSEPTPDDEEFDARITLRLPPTLKSTIERFANPDGESVNTWVVEALSRTARRQTSTGGTVTEEFDL
ncbi:MAG: toxin-antitoxin system HicB family antitoxin [Ilumatobacteraceae bacterium]